MKKDIKIKIKTSIIRPEGTEQIEQETAGQYFRKGDQTYIRYREPAEAFGQTTTIIKIGEKAVEIVRQGDLTAKQVFKQGYREKGRYHSPYGIMDMETETEHIGIVRKNDQVQTVNIIYKLTIQAHEAGIYHMVISLQEGVG